MCWCVRVLVVQCVSGLGCRWFCVCWWFCGLVVLCVSGLGCLWFCGSMCLRFCGLVALCDFIYQRLSFFGFVFFVDLYVI